MGEFRGRRLSQYDGPGLLEPQDGGGIKKGDKIGKDLRAARGLYSCRIEDIFNPQGNSMEGPASSSSGDFLFATPGFFQDLLTVQGHPSLDGRLQDIDAFQERFSQGHRREFSAMNLPDHFG
jgi:hypothetical protein